MAKKKGIHANEKSGLRPLKKDEHIVYYGAGFHIIKKELGGKNMAKEKTAAERMAFARSCKKGVSRSKKAGKKYAGKTIAQLKKMRKKYSSKTKKYASISGAISRRRKK